MKLSKYFLITLGVLGSLGFSCCQATSFNVMTEEPPIGSLTLNPDNNFIFPKDYETYPYFFRFLSSQQDSEPPVSLGAITLSVTQINHPFSPLLGHLKTGNFLSNFFARLEQRYGHFLQEPQPCVETRAIKNMLSPGFADEKKISLSEQERNTLKAFEA